MITKLIFTIIDEDHTFRVFMSQNYPCAAYESLKEALQEFPRIETGDFGLNFGAEFLAANKKFSKAYPGGEVHLTYLYRERGDRESRFEIFVKDNKTFLKIYDIHYQKELEIRGREGRLWFEGSWEKFLDYLEDLDYELAQAEIKELDEFGQKFMKSLKS